MSAPSLSRLNNRTIAIDLVIDGRQIRVSGRAHFETASPSGQVLKIHVADPAGDFDILLEEGRFSGPIVEDAASGEVRIALEAADLTSFSS